MYNGNVHLSRCNCVQRRLNVVCAIRSYGLICRVVQPSERRDQFIPLDNDQEHRLSFRTVTVKRHCVTLHCFAETAGEANWSVAGGNGTIFPGFNEGYHDCFSPGLWNAA